MKLFEIEYMEDCDSYAYLTVGENKQEVESREYAKLLKKCSCLYSVWVSEVKSVDGYKINLIKEEE